MKLIRFSGIIDPRYLVDPPGSSPMWVKSKMFIMIIRYDTLQRILQRGLDDETN